MRNRLKIAALSSVPLLFGSVTSVSNCIFQVQMSVTLFRRRAAYGADS